MGTPDSTPPQLHIDRYFGPAPEQKSIARRLYKTVRHLPLVCPHGHVQPHLFAEEEYLFLSAADLFITPDHYILRMLYSQGISLESLGVRPLAAAEGQMPNHREVWQLFADHFHLFRGTPAALWFQESLAAAFGITTPFNSATAQQIYNEIDHRLNEPEYAARRLYERFNIEVLCTTDAATDTLESHQQIRAAGWHGRILPTFRPDALLNLDTPAWQQHCDALSQAAGIDLVDYPGFISALEKQRAFFKKMGAVATDHSAQSPFTTQLTPAEAERIFQRARRGQASADDARRFTGHMLMEMARMSVEDGLVMQLHTGALRNHNPLLAARFGPDMGGDIPLRTEFTRNLHPLLTEFGNDPRFSLILFTLDESAYARELAPLAGHYPTVKLGPPWWFHDSLNGMRRYFDQVMETAGLYNTVGFNDDTRAFLSIPARHEMWRRAAANWLAEKVLRRIITEQDAADMAMEMAVGLARRAYKLNTGTDQ